MSLNDDLVDPEALVVDVDEEAYYDPSQEDENVVVVEPKILSIGRKAQRDNLRKMRESGSDPQRDY